MLNLIMAEGFAFGITTTTFASCGFSAGCSFHIMCNSYSAGCRNISCCCSDGCFAGADSGYFSVFINSYNFFIRRCPNNFIGGIFGHNSCFKFCFAVAGKFKLGFIKRNFGCGDINIQCDCGKHARVAADSGSVGIHSLSGFIQTNSTMSATTATESCYMQTTYQSVCIFYPIFGNFNCYSMRFISRCKSIVTKSGVISSKLGSIFAVILNSAVGIVNTGKFVHGVIYIAKLNFKFGSRHYFAFFGNYITFVVGNYHGGLLGGYNLIGCNTVFFNTDNMASLSKSGNSYFAGFLVYSNTFCYKAVIGKTVCGKSCSCNRNLASFFGSKSKLCAFITDIINRVMFCISIHVCFNRSSVSTDRNNKNAGVFRPDCREFFRSNSFVTKLTMCRTIMIHCIISYKNNGSSFFVCNNICNRAVVFIHFYRNNITCITVFINYSISYIGQCNTTVGEVVDCHPVTEYVEFESFVDIKIDIHLFVYIEINICNVHFILFKIMENGIGIKAVIFSYEQHFFCDNQFFSVAEFSFVIPVSNSVGMLYADKIGTANRTVFVFIRQNLKLESYRSVAIIYFAEGFKEIVSKVVIHFTGVNY